MAEAGRIGLRGIIIAGVLAGLMGGPVLRATAASPPVDSPEARQEAERLNRMPAVVPHGKARLDTSGRKQVGRASYYSHRLANRKMANGRRMNPNADIAASKTLPLGSVAKVTNLDNGKSATVKIEDRGPFAGGRMLDVAPKVADQLDIGKDGVATVEVKPITVPQSDGGVKLGSGAADLSQREVRAATEATRQLAGSTNETAGQ